jgi:hypothetical protein
MTWEASVSLESEIAFTSAADCLVAIATENWKNNLDP